MWIITVRGPHISPRDVVVPPGKLTIGCHPGSDIVLTDESASREHAVLEYVAEANTLAIHDFGSLSGTFVNHERVTGSRTLQANDQIRIGQHLLRVAERAAPQAEAALSAAEVQPITRELVLESLDRHAMLLVDVSERLNPITDLTTALTKVSSILAQALGVDRCQIVPADQFPFIAQWGLPPLLAQRALSERAVVVIPDVEAAAGVDLGQPVAAQGIRSLMCLPILLDDEAVALIYVYTTPRTERLLSQADVQLAVAIGHQASLTLQRARLLENVGALNQLATTDHLTQVYSRGHFFELGEHELQRARRYLRPLSAIIVDIDHFMQVNDTQGYATGDEILRAVAARCRLAVRQADLVGRFGADKFAILTLENDAPAAHAIAERLRRQVAGSPIYTDRGLVHITISLGIAALSAATPNLATLLNEADEALFAAKQSGRDRIAIAGSTTPAGAL